MSESKGDKPDHWWMSRRAFLSSGAAAGVATVALGAPAQGATTAPESDIDAMVLQVAAAVAVFPIKFETYEAQSARARLTGTRVAKARGRISAARTKEAESGAQLLIDRGLGGVDTAKLLEQLGAIVADADKSELADLQALVMVAGATLADRINPASNLQAKLWLDGLAIMHNNGATPVVGG